MCSRLPSIPRVGHLLPRRPRRGAADACRDDGHGTGGGRDEAPRRRRHQLSRDDVAERQMIALRFGPRWRTRRLCRRPRRTKRRAHQRPRVRLGPELVAGRPPRRLRQGGGPQAGGVELVDRRRCRGTLQRVTGARPWSAVGRLVVPGRAPARHTAAKNSSRSSTSRPVAAPSSPHRAPATSFARRRLARRLARGLSGAPRRGVDARRLPHDVRRILSDPSAEEFVWAPNGRTIAYHARNGEGWSVWTIEI